MQLQIKLSLNENKSAALVAKAILVFEDENGPPLDIAIFHVFWRNEESEWVAQAAPRLDLLDVLLNDYRKRIETAVLVAFHRERQKAADA